MLDVAHPPIEPQEHPSTPVPPPLYPSTSTPLPPLLYPPPLHPSTSATAMIPPLLGGVNQVTDGALLAYKMRAHRTTFST